MKLSKKIIALLLSLILTFSFAFTGLAAGEKELVAVPAIEKMLWNVIDGLFCGVVEAIGHFFPTPADWKDSTANAEGFMEGTETFAAEAGSVWRLGYDARSIMLSAEETIGKLNVAGSIGFAGKKATEIIDDLKVRTVALNDSTGRGTAVFAVVDCYGLALSDVREIRTRLAEYAAENGINSITVSVLHQHSAVDTFGMNGNIFEMVLFNPAFTLFGQETVNGKDDRYMENLFEKCSESIKAAVENMTEGKLYLGTADASKYTIDKRQPYVMDPSFTRLRFVPSDGSEETWIVNSPIHCVGNGAAGTAITGDYPYYAEETVKAETGANLMFVLGAEQSTTQCRDESTIENYSEDMSRMELTVAFGKSIAKELIAIDSESEVAPLLNIRYSEVLLSIDNPVLLLAGKASLFENIIREIDGEYMVLTEVGYMELGNDLAYAIIPGELAPELAYGGCLTGDYAWSGEDWQYPSMQELVADSGRTLGIIGIANDQIGYIVPDNSYIPMLHESSNSIEFVSLGKNTASAIVEAFAELTE